MADCKELGTSWPVVVIGGGIAGPLVAIGLARQGVRVLLVEAKQHPRAKPCGGCLNARVIDALSALGLDRLLTEAGAVRIAETAFWLAGRELNVATPPMWSVTRAALDARLLAAARDAGVTVLEGTRAAVLPDVGSEHRYVDLLTGDLPPRQVAAGCVVCCDGLGHPALSQLDEFRCEVAPHSRVGLATTMDAAATCRSRRPRLEMLVGRHGYVGLSPAEGGTHSLAAAVDRVALAELGPARLVASIVAEADPQHPLPDSLLAACAWLGTKPLTQQSRRVSGDRLLLVGDAAGYVEPITGEGMASAADAALECAHMLAHGGEIWRPEYAPRWQSTMHRLRRRGWLCRSAAWLVRRPWLALPVHRALRWLPEVPRQVARQVARTNLLTLKGLP